MSRDYKKLCGSCKHYDEWRNGYCNKLNIEVEPEECCCELYEDEEEESDE